MLAVLVCTYVGLVETLAMTVTAGPIYEAVGICLCCD